MLGIALNLEPDTVGVVLLGESDQLVAGSTAFLYRSPRCSYYFFPIKVLA